MVNKGKDISNKLEYYHYMNGYNNRGVSYYVRHLVKKVLKQFYVLLNMFLKDKQSEDCDILVAGTCDVDIKHSYRVWETLGIRGYDIKFEVPSNRKLKKLLDLLGAGKVPVDREIPAEYFFQYLYTKVLLKRYNPKLVCIFHSAGLIPTLLREQMHGRGMTAYIPHGVINYLRNYTSIDYDYYLLFGQGSLNCLIDNEVRFGNSKVVKTGSPMVGDIKKNLPTNQRSRFLFFSSWDLESDDPAMQDFKKDFDIFLGWARSHPEYDIAIKLHPIERGIYVSDRVNGISNIKIMDKSLTLMQSLRDVGLVITMYSVATMEAALLGIPALVVNHREYDLSSNNYKLNDKILFLEKFFLPRAKNSNELDDRVKSIQSNYDYYVGKCKEYVDYHFEHHHDSIEKVSDVLESILQGKEDFHFTVVNEKFCPPVKALSERKRI